MTEDRLPLAELVEKAGDGDFLRAVAEAVPQLLMGSEVEGLIGAARHERSAERLTCRDGFRGRAPDTRLGTLRPRVPKLRQGARFPPFLGPREVGGKALVAVVREARIGGVSTRRVDEPVRATGLAGISKSTVPALGEDVDERVNAFLDRPLGGERPHPGLDATRPKVRDGGRIVSVAATIAVAVDAEGRREIVGPHLGPSEAETFWAACPRGLVRRGLEGVKLVISDAHAGLEAAIRRVLGATRQRCRVDWMRSALAHVGKGRQAVVAAARRRAFLRADETGARQVWRRVADQPRPRRSKLAALMDESGHDVLAYMGFPAQHRAEPHGTDVLERLDEGVTRRADAVGISPREAPITRPIGAVPLEQDDGRRPQHRRVRVEATAALTTPLIEGEVTPATPARIPPRAA